MKARNSFVALLIIASMLFLFALSLIAQEEQEQWLRYFRTSHGLIAQDEEPKEQLYLAWDFIVKPDKISEFEAVAKKRNAYYQTYNYPHQILCYSASDFQYYAIAPIENFAGVESLYTARNKITDKHGDEWQEINQGFTETYEYFKPFFVTFRPDISYIPESPRLQADEGKFISWIFIYVKPGKSSEFVEIMKKWVELFKDKNIPTGFNTFAGGIGTEQPLYILASSGKSAADYFTQEEKEQKIVGEDARKLGMKALPLIRKSETKTGMYRPGLSYTPEK